MISALLETRALEWIDSSDGVRLPLFDLGGDGPTLLTAHATGFHGRVYDPLLASLDGCRRYTADLRGHGDAEVPGDLEYHWESFADDLLAAVAALGDRVPLLGFGHSMGAACLLMVEQRLPGTFRGLFCYEPVIHPPGAANDSVRLEGFVERTRNRRATFASRDEALANYRSKSPYSRFDPRALAAYVEHGFADDDSGVRIKCRPQVEAQIYRMGPRHRTFESLGAIACPVLVASGGRGEPGPSQWAGRIAAEMPGARLQVFDDLGHLGPLEDPEAVARAATEFFRSLS